MEFLTDLWLPILVAAVFVFIVSSVIHVVIPVHKNDHKKLPGEDPVLASMRDQKVAPGSYMFPFPASMKDCGSPEMLEKFNRGPVGFVTVLPNGPMGMGKSLVQWFIFSILVGVVTAYVASLTLQAGAEFSPVFRITGTVAFIAYGFGVIPDAIWKGQSWATTMKFVFDGLLYGLSTGAAFGWLWPGA